MTTTKEPHRTSHGKLSMAEILEVFAATGRHPLKFTAYDGSTAGNEDAELGLDLRSPAAPPIWRPPRRTRPRPRLRVGRPAGVRRPSRRPVPTAQDAHRSGGIQAAPVRVLANVVRSLGFERLLPVAPPRRRRCQGGGASPTG